MSYSEYHGITRESIQEDLDCSESIAKKILSICEKGYQHGLNGLYLGEDYTRDIDWVDSVGRIIESISEDSGLDEDDILSYYDAAIMAGYSDSDEAELTEEDDLDGFLLEYWKLIKEMVMKNKTKTEVIQFWLRKDFEANIIIPQNMTKEEAERLCIAIKTQVTS